jgi:hypothetical protein
MEKRTILRATSSVAVVGVVTAATSGSALAVEATGSSTTDLVFATSEIAQVILSIAAVSFAILAARAYGGEIGKAIYIASGGVVIFGSWQLLNAMSQLLELSRPPIGVGSTVNLVVTILLMAGFYLLYETISGHTHA